MVVVLESLRRGTADQGNVLRRQSSQLVLNLFRKPQPVQSDESISYVVAGPQAVDQSRRRNSESTGVDASGEPEGRPARRPAGSAPVRPLASVVWPTVQSDGSDIA